MLLTHQDERIRTYIKYSLVLSDFKRIKLDVLDMDFWITSEKLVESKLEVEFFTQSDSIAIGGLAIVDLQAMLDISDPAFDIEAVVHIKKLFCVYS